MAISEQVKASAVIFAGTWAIESAKFKGEANFDNNVKSAFTTNMQYILNLLPTNRTPNKRKI